MVDTMSPKLPKNPVNGQEVSDRYGNIWQYFADNNSWISKGTVGSIATVSDKNDGLVPPLIYDKLKRLSNAAATTNLTNYLKITPGKDAYWYYFRSQEKLFRFTPENESVLRIEVDRGRLYQVLSKVRKTGARGPKGFTGIDGLDGYANSDVCDPINGEPSFIPSKFDGGRLDFAIFTPTPLTIGGPVV